MAQKKFQDLNLKDAFLFAAALSDAETCKLVLEIILGEKVASLKESRKWEKNYMTFGELLDDAKAETFTAAQNRFCLLIEKMTAAGESDKLPLLSDAAFLQEMYQKYGLSDCI